MDSNAPKTTDFAQLLPDLNAGVFEQQVNHALSDIAANVCTHGRKGKLTITLTVTQIGEGSQVNVSHALVSVVPTKRGRVTEETTSDTPLHVGSGGVITLLPNKQTKMELGAGSAAPGKRENAGG